MSGKHEGPDPAMLDALVQVRVVRLAELISQRARRTYETGFGLKNTELRILIILARSERALTVSELGRQSRVDKAWISRSLNGLCARGLVERVQDPSHPRAPLLGLTGEGLAMLRALAPAAQDHQSELISGLAREEVERVLDILLRNAEAQARAEDGRD